MPLLRWVAVAIALVLALAGCSGSKGGAPAAERSAVEELLATALVKQQAGELDAAKVLYLQVLKQDPGNVTAHYDLGVIYQQQNLDQQALAEYDAALKTDPTYVPALYNKGTVLQGSNQPLEAIKVFNEVIKLQPIAPTAYFNLGTLEIALGQVAIGQAHIKTALEQDPKLVEELSTQEKELAEDGGGGKAKDGKGGKSPGASPTATPTS